MAKATRKPPANASVMDLAQPQRTPNQLKGIDNPMPKGVKNGASGAKSVYVKFTEPEDIALYNRLVEDARSKRYPVDVYITLVLLEAYPSPASEAPSDPPAQG